MPVEVGRSRGATKALRAGWENWSWGSDLDFAATDLFEGTSSISVNSQPYSALSLKLDGTFPNYQGLRFDIADAPPDLTIYISSSVDGTASPNLVLSAISTSITPDAFTSLLIDFRDLPVPGSGTALASGNGAGYHIDNIVVVETIIFPPLFLSAKPLAANTIAVTTPGDVDLSSFAVSLNGKSVKIVNTTSYTPIGTPFKSNVTYLTLAENFAPGTLLIDTGAANGGNPTFNVTLPAVQYASFVQHVSHPISPLIYGVNFPASASYIQDLGVTMSRWGGNAVTAYNPNGQFTNAGNDWYFENRGSDDAAEWLGWVQGAGSQTLLTVPALDWVSKDATSYSYPASTDPFLANAGNGLFSNGSYTTPVPDPTNVWLKGLANKPTMVAIDNEIEIASNTHQDMHPIPVDYDEELARVLNFSIAAKEAIPGVKVATPLTCLWWYYWRSQVGYTETAAHDNIDFLPWFLAQMAAAEKTNGQRLLDYLDIHFYYQTDTSANDAAAKALRLRMTREFTSTADKDITGGLVTVDMLGIFGQQKLDSATYWATPDERSPVGRAYWLYRGFGVHFGTNSVQVNLTTPNPDTQGVYAATENGKLSVVIVNKNPDTPITFTLTNMPRGSYFLRHFGGEAGAFKWQVRFEVRAIAEPNFDSTASSLQGLGGDRALAPGPSELEQGRKWLSKSKGDYHRDARAFK
ncbi:glycoside hydrolase family 44-domain-containing protein [Mycena rebaudengoi]|nr:glycoside hydrolase family 44-domain-containing protein [Mycena rebaudengoi]